MNVLVTGATGLVGTAVSAHLSAAGHRVFPLRRKSSGSNTQSSVTWDIDAGRVDLSGAGAVDAVIHLAGESVAQRWTESAKQRIRRSRVQGTQVISEALARLEVPPAVLVCASATGYYGDRGSEWLDESSDPGTGFLAEVCAEWEGASAAAKQAGIRVVHVRLGIVLSGAGGALPRMLPAFKLGLAGRLGDGGQYWSWIALRDAVAAMAHVLERPALIGAVNLVAPFPVTNAEFTHILGRLLHRPAILPVPRMAIRALFGQMGQEALLASARVRPGQLMGSGFEFRDPELVGALQTALQG